MHTYYAFCLTKMTNFHFDEKSFFVLHSKSRIGVSPFIVLL